MSGQAVRTPYWHAMLCAETRDEIASRMREVLGDHYFTLVISNSYSEGSHLFTSPEIYPSQWLTGEVMDYRDATLPGLTWATPRLSMGVHSQAATQAEARDGGVHKYVRFTFEPDRVVIDHYAPAGYRLQWAFAVERHDREDYR